MCATLDPIDSRAPLQAPSTPTNLYQRFWTRPEDGYKLASSHPASASSSRWWESSWMQEKKEKNIPSPTYPSLVMWVRWVDVKRKLWNWSRTHSGFEGNICFSSFQFTRNIKLSFICWQSIEQIIFYIENYL